MYAPLNLSFLETIQWQIKNVAASLTIAFVIIALVGAGAAFYNWCGNRKRK